MVKDKPIVARIGSIYFIDLGIEVDHRIARKRPSVVVENNERNVTVYAFTHDDGSPPKRSEIKVPKGVGGLKRNSKIKLGQTITIDRKHIIHYIGELPDKYLEEIQDYILYKGIIKKLKSIIKRRRTRFNSINTASPTC